MTHIVPPLVETWILYVVADVVAGESWKLPDIVAIPILFIAANELKPPVTGVLELTDVPTPTAVDVLTN